MVRVAEELEPEIGRGQIDYLIDNVGSFPFSKIFNLLSNNFLGLAMRFADPKCFGDNSAQQDRRFDTSLGLRLFRFPHSRPGRNGQRQRRRQTVSMAGIYPTEINF
jgi:hypothetical protein